MEDLSLGFPAGDIRNFPLVKHQLQEGSEYMSLYTGHDSNMTIEGNASVNYERLFAAKHRVSGLMLFSIRNHQKNVPASYIYAFPSVVLLCRPLLH